MRGCLFAQFDLLFLLTSKVFSTTLHTWLGFPHPLALSLSHCICGQPLDLTGIHFFCYTHGGERMASHDVVWDAFVSIMKDA